jgi:hypothetical protein
MWPLAECSAPERAACPAARAAWQQWLEPQAPLHSRAPRRRRARPTCALPAAASPPAPPRAPCLFASTDGPTYQQASLCRAFAQIRPAAHAPESALECPGRAAPARAPANPHQQREAGHAQRSPAGCAGRPTEPAGYRRAAPSMRQTPHAATLELSGSGSIISTAAAVPKHTPWAGRCTVPHLP